MARDRQPGGGHGPSVRTRGGRPPLKPTGLQMSVAVVFLGREDFTFQIRKIIEKEPWWKYYSCINSTFYLLFSLVKLCFIYFNVKSCFKINVGLVYFTKKITFVMQ